MEELESQVAKIQIGNPKHVHSYVFLVAEKAPVGTTELYVVAELPMFNPAAESSCEKICLAIAGALKRTYKKNLTENVFETAIAQVNEELGKLAEMGQTNWIDKLSCILAAKDGSDFSIATCGKVAAYLYRSGEFTDISCSAPKAHPLKTFENIAFGKLKLEDITVLSTTQLFNYLSVDRLKTIFENGDFLSASQTVIEILKENAGPEVSFGTIFNMQVRPGETTTEEIDLEDYEASESKPVGFLSKTLGVIKSMLIADQSKRTPKVSLPHISFSGSLQSVKDSTKTLGSKSKEWMKNAATVLQNTTPKKALGIEHMQSFSKQKKIFLASIIVLLIALIANVVIGSHIKKTRQAQTKGTVQLSEVQGLIASAQSSLLYKDDAKAQEFIKQAIEKLPVENLIPDSQKEQYTQTKLQLDDLKQKMEKNITGAITNLGSLGQGQKLFHLGNYLATQVGSTIVSYNMQTGAVSDGLLLSSEKIQNSVYIKNSTAVVYTGNSLRVWDFEKKQFSDAFTQSVPEESDTVGLTYYPTNSRIYTINKKTNQILNFLVGSSISKPVVASKNANDLGNSLDLAIDGSIYVLNKNGVNKYQSGTLTDFTLPFLFVPFSGSGHIATEINWKNIYILDSGNNRIIIVDKKGSLVGTVKAQEFSKLTDFYVDEPSKTIYVLNDGALLKATLP